MIEKIKWLDLLYCVNGRRGVGHRSSPSRISSSSKAGERPIEGGRERERERARTGKIVGGKERSRSALQHNTSSELTLESTDCSNGSSNNGKNNVKNNVKNNDDDTKNGEATSSSTLVLLFSRRRLKTEVRQRHPLACPSRPAQKFPLCVPTQRPTPPITHGKSSSYHAFSGQA
jgi:hypothetical protein